MNFANKTVLITGGAKRVGAAVSRGFAEAGATVIIHCLHSTSEAEELRQSLPGSAHRVLSADLADPEAVGKLFYEAGKIDVLVNNASRYLTSPLFEAAPERDREQLEVNFWAPLTLIRAFASQNGLRAGAVVNFVDQEIFRSCAAHGIYSLSRRLLAAATEELAVELGPRNVRVNAIAPGPVLPPPEFAGNGMKKTLPMLPLRRRVELADLVSAVLFLAANESITGAVLPVDCGQHLN